MPLPSLKATTSILLVALAAFAVAACGPVDTTTTPEEDEPTPAPATTLGGAAMEFSIELLDDRFEPAAIVVPPGSGVALYLTNGGAAIHNLRIAGADGEFETDDDALSDPDTVPGGEAATVSWVAPAEESEIPYRCDFQEEMTGVITVQ